MITEPITDHSHENVYFYVRKTSENCQFNVYSAVFNPILDGGGGKSAPSWFLNTAQKLLGVGSRNFVTFSINV